MADWTSGLDDSQAATGRSVTAPLDELGIDPDEARLNRAAVMAQLGQSPLQRMQQAYLAGTPPGPMSVSRPAAAAPAPSPVPKSAPAVSPSGSSQPRSMEDYGRSGLDSLEQNLARSTDAASQIPTEDTESQALEKQRLADVAARPQAYDPTTGKLVDKYKPSVGQKIVRGLEGAGLGLVSGGILGAVGGAVNPNMVGVAGYNAPTPQFGRDVERNTQKVAADDQQIQAAKDRWKNMVDAQKARASEFRANAGLGKDIVTGSTDIQKAQTEQAKLPIEAQKAFNESPEAKAQLQETEFNQRNGQADRLGLKGTNRTYFIFNGKMPDPQQPNEAMAQMQSLRQAEAAFRAEHGGKGPQTLADYNAIRAASAGQLANTLGLGSAGGSSTAIGQEFLNSLPAGMRTQVQAIGEGRMAPPSSRSKQSMEIMSAVTRAYPDFDQSRYKTYEGMRKDMTSGKSAQTINSFNTALAHLGRLEENLPNNTSVPLLNMAMNAGRRASGSQALKPFEADALAVSNEVERAYKGGALSEGDYNHMRSLLNENDSPAAMRSSIRELRGLLQGKLEAFQAQERAARPTGNVAPISTINPQGGFNWDAHPEAR